MAKQKLDIGRNWYAVHTYAGYEDAVARNLKQRIESLGYEDKIFNVLVPKEKKIKIKGGKRETVEEKIGQYWSADYGRQGKGRAARSIARNGLSGH